MDDTIAAIATPTGSGGIAVIRISGPKAPEILDNIFIPNKSDSKPTPYFLRFGRIVGQNGSEALDEVMAAYMPGSKSFTGEDMVEIYCHAGQFLAKAILDNILKYDCRPAEAGEFSQRRFLNHGVDLTRLEGSAEVVAAKTDLAFRLSKEHLLGAYGEHLAALREKMVHLLAEVEADIDFPEEESVGTIGRDKLEAELDGIIENLSRLVGSYQTGRIIQDGYRVVILGPPNAGKSSLFNRLVKQNRALVTPVPGTTRDWLSEWIDLDGLPVELYDTAGLAAGRGRVEKAGIAKTRSLIGRADLMVVVYDIASRTMLSVIENLRAGQDIIFVFNKIDLVDKPDTVMAKRREKLPPDAAVCTVSALTGRGLTELTGLIAGKAGLADLTESLVVTSYRHKTKLDRALAHLKRIRRQKNLPVEMISFELRQAAGRIDEITGHIYTEEILDKIFSRFCIGK
ncbi:MAG: tRNA uridine-5-carboxymethylaminomethyl(34) synthesis GTPase MnmE [candidate division Zixibacteria bacterium]|nr:tRNA uridine-5-carboxymethylaminomethyl(34) synthesis GTPase MnmE [candidate division Zixibacteria bacterium]